MKTNKKEIKKLELARAEASRHRIGTDAWNQAMAIVRQLHFQIYGN